MKKVMVKMYPNETAKSDLVRTFACSATPMYFVEFSDGYSGYFETTDVTDLSKLDALQIDNLRRSANGGLIGE